MRPWPTVLRGAVRGVLALGVAGLVAGAAAAQADLSTPGAAGAESAVRTYTEAIAASDWHAAGRVIDPAELEVMQELVAFITDVDTTGEAADLFGGAPDGDLDGVTAFAQFMDAVIGMQPMMQEGLASMTVEILGTVLEGDAVAHVVGRSQAEMFGASVENVEVTTVRWLGDRWAVQLDAQLRGMTDAMQGMMKAMDDDGRVFEEDWDDEDGG